MGIHLRAPIIAVLAALVLLAAAASPADARTKRFKPLDFVPQDSSASVIRSPVAVGSVAGTVAFNAPLGLPAGATITAMRMYSNGAAAMRSAGILGAAVGLPATTVVVSQSNTAGPDLLTPVVDDGELNPIPALRVISADMLYYVRLSCSAGTSIWAVDVDYTP